MEINSTFYGQPRAEIARRWAERTPERFEFSVKLYQKFTHPEMFKDRLRRAVGGPAAPDTPRASAGKAPQEPALDSLVRPNLADLDEFRRGIDPLASSGKLGALLAQFPPSFKSTPASRDYLATLLAAFHDYRVAVELRHKGWSDALADTLTLLNEHGAAWVQIDEPKFKFSIRQNYLPNVKGFYYMRLHGRNAEQWWRHERSEDRYNYLYSAGELKEFSETAAAARQLVKKAYLYTNNHFSAQSVANAAMIKQQLGEPLEGDYPPAFVARFPDLAGAVNVSSGLTSPMDA